jgi:glutamyl-Q tRNA(Asp) synthetase
MASWLDARSVEGLWLIRIEDLDAPRNLPGADRDILETLAAFGMVADKPVAWQSQNLAAYWRAVEQLSELGLVYRCLCSRREIAEAGLASDGLPVYPGTCRDRGIATEPAALRVRVDHDEICFIDRQAGSIRQKIDEKVGDFVIRRADGVITYQLAVVVDDAAEGVTHVVRGADLLDSTARQIYLQRCLGLPTPKYWHVPLVVNQAGEKLSKQTGATALARDNVLPTLHAAAEHLGLSGLSSLSIEGFWRAALVRFREQQAERLNQRELQKALSG